MLNLERESWRHSLLDGYVFIDCNEVSAHWEQLRPYLVDKPIIFSFIRVQSGSIIHVNYNGIYVPFGCIGNDARDILVVNFEALNAFL